MMKLVKGSLIVLIAVNLFACNLIGVVILGIVYKLIDNL